MWQTGIYTKIMYIYAINSAITTSVDTIMARQHLIGLSKLNGSQTPSTDEFEFHFFCFGIDSTICFNPTSVHAI